MVKDTNTKRSKGFGYVSFAIEEDANAAIDTLNGKDVDGRSIIVELATRNNRTDSNNKYVKKAPSTYTVKQSMRLVLVWISSSGDKDDLENTLRKRLEACGKVESLSILNTMSRYRVLTPSAVANVRVAEALMSTAAEAKTFVQKNDRQRVKSYFIMAARRLCSFASSRKAQQNCELIIRNLPFKITKDQIVETCSRFGPIASVRVLKGFCFVRFHFKADAARSLKQLNAKPFGENKNNKNKKKKRGKEDKDDEKVEKARVVAVDWALNKQAYENIKQNEESSSDSSSSSDSDSDSDSDSEPKFEISGFENNNNDVEEEIKIPPPAPAGTTLFVCNVPLSASRGDVLRTFGKFGHIESVKMVRDKDSGAFRGSVFVQYKSKDSADKALSRSDSVVAGGRMKESTNARGSGPLRVLKIHDRPLVVRRAVNKNEAKSLSEQKKSLKKKIDKRNLHLVQEGRITRNMDVAKSLKESELRKRERGDRDKHEKLRSPLFFVSPTRLAIRNLSTSGELSLTAKLRRAALKAAQDGVTKGKVNLNQVAIHLRPVVGEESNVVMSPDAVQVTACSVLRDKERRDAKGRPRSRGVAFVEFSQHVHALAALRILNNNPQFSKLSNNGSERLIVEFSVENRAMLKKQQELRQQREEENKRKAETQRIIRERAELLEELEGGSSSSSKTTSASKDNKEEKLTKRGRASKRKKLSSGIKSLTNVGAVANAVIGVTGSTTTTNTSTTTKNEEDKKKRKKKKKQKKRKLNEDDLKIAVVEEEDSNKDKKKKRRRKKKGIVVDKDDIAFDGMVAKYKKSLFKNEGIDDRWFV